MSFASDYRGAVSGFLGDQSTSGSAPAGTYGSSTSVPVTTLGPGGSITGIVDTAIASAGDAQAGLIETATQAEVDAWTSTTVAVTPGRLRFPMGQIDYFNLTGTVITIGAQSDGSTNLVDLNMTTATAGLGQFDNGGANDGKLRYLGASPLHFHIAFTCSGTPQTGNDEFVFVYAIDGVPQTVGKVVGSFGSTQFTASHLMVTLNPNEVLSMKIGNITAGRNFTVQSFNLFALGMQM